MTGNPECGKSNSLAALGQAVMRAYRPDQARLYVVDPHKLLLQGWRACIWAATSIAEADPRHGPPRWPRCWRPARRPSTSARRSWPPGVRWRGPQVFVFVNNEETIKSWYSGMSFAAGAAGYPLESVLGFLDRGKEVGLHLVVSRWIGNWGRAVASPLVGRLLQLNAVGVVVDGPRSQGGILGGVLASSQTGGGVSMSPTGWPRWCRSAWRRGGEVRCAAAVSHGRTTFPS